jgi:hypothetical protein
MATWTDTATIKAGVTNGKPVIGTGGFGDQVADNLEHLYGRVNAIGIGSASGIHDDFTANTLNDSAAGGAYTWDVAGTPDLNFTLPRHDLHATGGEGVAASIYKMRFDLSTDHTLYFETRHRSDQSDAVATWYFGFRASSYAVNATTLTDSIIFRQGTTAQKYKCYLSKAGVNSTIVDDVGGGGTGVWYVLRIEITFAGATKKVEFFIDGVSVASTTDTTIIPLVELRPSVFHNDGGGTRHNFYDHIDADWTVRPLSV